MNPVLEKLLALQERDVRLARLGAEQSRLPEKKTSFDRQEKMASETVDQAKAATKRIETDRRKLEMEVNGKQDLIRKYKNQLLEIKNNEQFHALQHEITAVENEIRKIEDVELDLMEKSEQAQVIVKEVEAQLKETTLRLQLQRKELIQNEEIIAKQITALKDERAQLALKLDEDILDRYERIFHSKHGEAMVRIINGMCSGCHLKLTAQEIHHAQYGADLTACTNCGRILYWVTE